MVEKVEGGWLKGWEEVVEGVKRKGGLNGRKGGWLSG